MAQIAMPRAGKPLPTTAPWIWLLNAATLIGVMVSLWLALWWTPKEAVEGDVFRIFYIHVPIAWNMYLAFFVVFAASILYLWRREQIWDRVARVSAEVGLLFTTLVLITGSIWGRPVWGVYWTWDARLTTTLVLWFMYLAYLLLRSYAREGGQAPRYAAVLGIVAFVDVPIVQYSVTWWRTLHPQSDILAPGHLTGSMLIGLFASLVSFTLLGLALFVQRYRIEMMRDESRTLRQRLEEAEG
jgi:heme exporter protein C